jgi:hypothetical protein
MPEGSVTAYFRISLEFITTFVICSSVLAVEAALVARGVLPLPDIVHFLG